jgi:hypothetical protein
MSGASTIMNGGAAGLWVSTHRRHPRALGGRRPPSGPMVDATPANAARATLGPAPVYLVQAQVWPQEASRLGHLLAQVCRRVLFDLMGQPARIDCPVGSVVVTPLAAAQVCGGAGARVGSQASAACAHRCIRRKGARGTSGKRGVRTCSVMLEQRGLGPSGRLRMCTPAEPHLPTSTRCSCSGVREASQEERKSSALP